MIADDVAGVSRPDPFLDERAEVQVPEGDLFEPVPGFDFDSDEDTTVVRARHARDAARRRGRTWTLAAIVVVVGAVGVVVAVVLARDRAGRADHVGLTGPPVVLHNGAVIVRTWDLSGRDGDRLGVTLRVSNPTTKVIGEVDEIRS